MSNIDPTIPTYALATTQSVRDNFGIAKTEIEALQAAIDAMPFDVDGTVGGPLIYTATGGTVARSAQDRAADVANVLDFGADPTGVRDSAPAFNAAASYVGGRGKRAALYAPFGDYLLRSQLRLTDGQSLLGDGPGVTVLLIADNFDPTATSVILCTASVVDPGPTIEGVSFWFVQPGDVASRATFKTLAAGGTSGTGGTGVQYPWAIATEGNSGRIIIRNVNINGSWNGINADNACFWIAGLRICSFNIHIAIGGTIASYVADWAHLSDIEFWCFGLNTTALQNVYTDGNTVAMRIGAQNGLKAQNIDCFTSKIIFTPDAAAGWFQFTNLSMDTASSTISVLGCFFLQFVNCYYTAGSDATAPAISTSGAAASAVRSIIFANCYGHSSSAFPLLDMSGGGDVSLTNTHFIPANNTANAIRVTAGTLRMCNGKIYPANASAWTVPLIYQDNTGTVQIDNVDFQGDSPGGIAVRINQDSPGNILGSVSLGAGWTNSVVGRVNGQYGPWASSQSPTFYGNVTFAGSVLGMSFGVAVGSSVTDTSKHLTLHNAGFGIGVTNGRINYVAAGAAAHVFNVNGLDRFSVSDTAATLSVRLATPGLSFGSVMSGDALDVSHHLEFYAGFAGISVTSGQVNFVCGGRVALAMTNTGSGVGLPALLGSPSYSNDAAAAAGGVLPGFCYRNGSAVMIRVA